jgi:hypothetical protein
MLGKEPLPSILLLGPGFTQFGQSPTVLFLNLLTQLHSLLLRTIHILILTQPQIPAINNLRNILTNHIVHFLFLEVIPTHF